MKIVIYYYTEKGQKVERIFNDKREAGDYLHQLKRITGELETQTVRVLEQYANTIKDYEYDLYSGDVVSFNTLGKSSNGEWGNNFYRCYC